MRFCDPPIDFPRMGDKRPKPALKIGTTGRTMVPSQIDTVETLMAHYVAGSLPEPARVLVSAHLEMKPDNRAVVAGMDRLAGDMLEKVQPVAIANKDRCLADIFRSSPPQLT
jgi:putative transcriptional regulator